MMAESETEAYKFLRALVAPSGESARRFLLALAPNDDKPDAYKFLRALAAHQETGQPAFSLSEPKRAANGDLEISGYASVFGNVDKASEVVDRGAFAASLAMHAKEGTMPYMFLQHDIQAGIIGRWDSLVEDGHGLLAKGRIFAGVQRGSDVIAMIEGGALDGLSVGYKILEADKSGSIRHLKKLNLIEVSIVLGPANPSARLHMGS
jgi:HK97 family phage prohead protease